MGQIFQTIKITWWENGTVTWLTVHGLTEAQAWDNARHFGCIKPKWFQFWLRRPLMEKTL
jgi:hypothetical protein